MLLDKKVIAPLIGGVVVFIMAIEFGYFNYGAPRSRRIEFQDDMYLFDKMRLMKSSTVVRNKSILLFSAFHGSKLWWFKADGHDFDGCQYSDCNLSTDEILLTSADLVMTESITHIYLDKNDRRVVQFWKASKPWPEFHRPKEQVWTFFARESQSRTKSGKALAFAQNTYNYTITFQRDADIFYPYGHLEPLPKGTNVSLPDYFSKKNESVLWLVSNCQNDQRMRYAKQLNRYIHVDMFGKCNREVGDPCHKSYSCVMNMKMRYKFYLAFENSDCRDYITEKFWKALHDGIVPIVMGPPREDYERVAPSNSFIHVDDFLSPELLAQHLNKVGNNHTLYNKYHNWRKALKVQWNSMTCDLCRLATEKPPRVRDITQTWNADMQCKLRRF